jgi:hypothetical protein
VAITIDPLTSIISVPQADMTFVSGTFYRLPTETLFRAAVNAILASEDGIVFDDAINHNTEVTVAGVTYARFIEVINGYSVQMTPDAQFTVELTESNNNLHDVGAGILVQNQVQVLTTNSAGLIVNAAQALTAIIAPGTIILIEGTTSGGVPANVNLRDAVTWDIAEDTLTGIDIEFQFTVADPLQKLVSFNVFGRYTGSPALHYQELWAWNVEQAAWEQLHEVFIEDSTDFREYDHALSEVHVNRSTGLVRVRIVHNVTNYNAGHSLFLDSVNISVHIPVTVSRIANAVWNHIKALTLPKWLGLR